MAKRKSAQGQDEQELDAREAPGEAAPSESSESSGTPQADAQEEDLRAPSSGETAVADDSPDVAALAQAEETRSQSDEAVGIPIVGIGASAGGLEAFEVFFRNTPPNTGIGFVLIQHLDPTHKSILSDLIRQYTRMNVFEVVDGMQVEANSVYVIPPDRDMSLLHGRLHLIEPVLPRGHRTPVDFFFRSLAQDSEERSVCIVLSGTGTEGALGIRAVKGAGGMAMAQDPKSAKYDGMPRSAIATGLVDYVLPPEAMPAQLIAYVQHFPLRTTVKLTAPVPTALAELQKVYVLLRAQTGHDFSLYKENTIIRRIERRLTVNQIDTLPQYIRYLQQNPLELDVLFKELLIEVTNFFRDAEAFDALTENVIPNLLENRRSDEEIRVWVTGCSTGEEAYSIAILFREYMEASNQEFNVQIFATDIDNDVIEVARAGVYPVSIAADVSPERLEQFFVEQDGTSYRVKKIIRDMLIFAAQSVIKDPPFSKVDLISCRNLLIYMGSELQKKVLPLFHYALNEDGYLFLGSSETIGEFTDLFQIVDRKWKIFRCNKKATPRYVSDYSNRFHLNAIGFQQEQSAYGGTISLRQLTEKALLDSYSPACIIINEKCDVLYVHGHTGRYLEPASGEASLNILKMAREGLQLQLSTAIRKVLNHQEEARVEGLLIRTNGGVEVVDVTVRPILKPASLQGYMMVVFEDAVPLKERPPGEEFDGSEEENQRVGELEQELRSTKEYLQTTIEELETSNEELKSTNEELQSSNEELQSTNEELETSKEELQSVNEELITVNSELEQKIEELSIINSDMVNLLSNTEVGLLFLDTEFHIRRFTSSVKNIINLIDTDIGRPIEHIVTNLKYDALVDDVKQTLETLATKEQEVQAQNGNWYAMRIIPYRTVENVIEGVVITFNDINEQKRVQTELQRARSLALAIVETVRAPLVILDDALAVVSANQAFYRLFQVNSENTEGRLIYDLGNRQWNIPELRELLENILPGRTSFEDFEVTHDFPGIGVRKVLLNARRIENEPELPEQILLAIEDVTEE